MGTAERAVWKKARRGRLMVVQFIALSGENTDMPITRYEDDLYLWAEETARAIAQGRFDEIDRGQVADEVEDLGKSEYHALASHLERIELHLLKIRYQEEKRTRSWELPVEESRVRVRRAVRRSPS